MKIDVKLVSLKKAAIPICNYQIVLGMFAGLIRAEMLPDMYRL